MRQNVGERLEVSPLELLHRASTYGDLQAWAAFQQSLEETVLTWFHDHPGREAVCRLQSERHFVALAFVGIVLILLGLPALYLRQARGRGGVVGLVGVLLVALGSFLGMATTAYFVSIAPMLAAKRVRQTSDRAPRTRSCRCCGTPCRMP